MGIFPRQGIATIMDIGLKMATANGVSSRGRERVINPAKSDHNL